MFIGNLRLSVGFERQDIHVDRCLLLRTAFAYVRVHVDLDLFPTPCDSTHMWYPRPVESTQDPLLEPGLIARFTPA